MITNGYTDIPRHAVSPRSFHEHADSLLLSAKDQFSVIRAILSSSGLRTLADYSAWLSWDLESLLHHRAWACGLGCLHHEGYNATYWLDSRSLNARCTLDQSLSRTAVSPLLTGWFNARRPQICERVVDHEAAAGGDDIFGSDRFDNAVLHCQMDPDNRWTSVFCFANMQGKPGFRERLLLDVLLPHLHAALCRVIIEESSAQARSMQAESVQARSESTPLNLTAKELLILRHMRMGRTNAEIADATHKSVFTVNNQVVKVLAKLGAKNRTQAVFMARELGLFKP